MELPLLTTKRLALTNWSTKDAPALFAYARNPNVGPAAGWEPHGSERYSRAVIRNFKAKGVFKIVWKETGKPIGTISLAEDRRRQDPRCRELGYSLDEVFWGRGIMSEAVEEILRYGFEDLGLSMVSVAAGTTNKRSLKLIEKTGFSYEGLVRHSYRLYDGTLIDERVYSMLRSEWEAARATRSD